MVCVRAIIMGSPANSNPPDPAPVDSRRRFLVTATATVAGVGLIASLYPFLASLWPSERTKVAGAPVQVNLSKLEPGQQITVEWRGKPVWILRRTPEMLNRMVTEAHRARLLDPDSSTTTQQPEYARNPARSIHPEHLVVVAICTHLGCVPTFRPDLAPTDLGTEWDGGYFCPCHGSRFDLAGRVYKSVPAPTNLVIPPYRYVGDSVVEIGVDTVQP